MLFNLCEILRPRNLLQLLIFLLAIKAEAREIKNTIQLGYGLSKEGLGVNAKYMRKVESMYLGAEIKFEEYPEWFQSRNPTESALSFRIPFGVMLVEEYYFGGIESGVGISKLVRQGMLISTECGEGIFSCHSEYEAIHKYGLGLSLEVSFGIIIKHFGIGLASGYEVNSFRSSPYVHLKLWSGY